MQFGVEIIVMEEKGKRDTDKWYGKPTASVTCKWFENNAKFPS